MSTAERDDCDRTPRCPCRRCLVALIARHARHQTPRVRVSRGVVAQPQPRLKKPGKRRVTLITFRRSAVRYLSIRYDDGRAQMHGLN